MPASSESKSLTPEQAALVRERLRELLEKEGYGGQTRVAKALDISQQHISRMTRARNPEDPGVLVALRLADVLGVSFDGLIGRKVPGSREESRVVRDPSTVPIFGNHPDWETALTAARERYRRIPPEAWEGASQMSAAMFPERGMLTPEMVAQLARTWEEMQAAPRKTEAEVQAEIDADEPLD